MKKINALLLMAILCSVTSMPLLVQAQSETALRHRAEISNAIHFDKTPKPLREMAARIVRERWDARVR